MKKLIIFSTALGLIAFSVSSCRQINKSIGDTLHGQPKQSKEDAFFSSSSGSNNTNFLIDVHALAQAENAFRNIPELKGKTLNVYDDMHMYDDGRIMLKIQDPDTLQNVNEYDYSSNKEWGPKQPVKIGSIEANNLNSLTIPLDSIHFVTVAKIAATYADSAKHYGSTTQLSHIYYVQEAHRWYCNDIEGTRLNYEIYFNANGSVKEFEKK
jgi:hypothetical protein